MTDSMKSACEHEFRKRYDLKCEQPCDSWGICENCSQVSDMHVGAEFIFKYLSEQAPEPLTEQAFGAGYDGRVHREYAARIANAHYAAALGAARVEIAQERHLRNTAEELERKWRTNMSIDGRIHADVCAERDSLKRALEEVLQVCRDEKRAGDHLWKIADRALSKARQSTGDGG